MTTICVQRSLGRFTAFRACVNICQVRIWLCLMLKEQSFCSWAWETEIYARCLFWHCQWTQWAEFVLKNNQLPPEKQCVPFIIEQRDEIQPHTSVRRAPVTAAEPHGFNSIKKIKNKKKLKKIIIKKNCTKLTPWPEMQNRWTKPAWNWYCFAT